MEVEEARQAEELEHHEMSRFAEGAAHNYAHASSFLSTLSSTSCTISYTPSAKVYLYILIALSCIGLIVGGAFTSIGIEDGNYNVAVAAFFAAVLSLGTLSLFLMHLFGRIEKYHDGGTLNGLKILGMIISVMSGVSLGVDTILAFLNKQDFSLQGENYFSGAVFSGVSLACSLKLYITAQWYQNAINATNATKEMYKVQAASP